MLIARKFQLNRPFPILMTYVNALTVLNDTDLSQATRPRKMLEQILGHGWRAREKEFEVLAIRE
jgi:hypothetical protein